MKIVEEIAIEHSDKIALVLDMIELYLKMPNMSEGGQETMETRKRRLDVMEISCKGFTEALLDTG